MHYREVIESREFGRVDRPLINPKPFQADVKLVVRFMPAVYRWLDLSIDLGEPDASISLDEARVTFVEPYSDDGTMTADCRDWIIDAVSERVQSTGLSMAVVFAADDAVYMWPRKWPIQAEEPPSGGLLI